MYKEVDIKYKGEEICVKGTFIEGEDPEYDYPGSPAEFDIDQVFYKEVDITSLLESLSVNIGDLEETVLEKIKD